MKILVVDNYDSFTFNLVHLVKELNVGEVIVRRNDKFDLAEVNQFDKIILSPGPGVPSEAGLMPELVVNFGSSKSILGVCLGHQCIGEVYGAKLRNLTSVFHGKGMNTRIVKEDLMFSGLPQEFESARYHSWVVDEDLSDELELLATDDNNLVMALRHKQFDVRGLQFHPESVLTPNGKSILDNWLKA